MSYKDFVVEAIGDLARSGVSIKLSNTSNIDFGEGNYCSGYFSGGEDLEDREFCVAMDSKFSNEVFIHEFSHFKQWKNKKSAWYKVKEKDEIDFWDWISGTKRMSKKRIKIASKGIRNLEEDCERRSVKLIKKWDMDIDIEDYKRKANSYIYFYTVIPEIKSWYKKGTPPHEVEEIMDIMPKTFLKNYDTPPKDYLNLIKKYCV
jgi:hypothetical protein